MYPLASNHFWYTFANCFADNIKHNHPEYKVSFNNSWESDQFGSSYLEVENHKTKEYYSFCREQLIMGDKIFAQFFPEFLDAFMSTCHYYDWRENLRKNETPEEKEKREEREEGRLQAYLTWKPTIERKD